MRRPIQILVVFALVAGACGDSAGGADPDRFCEIVNELENAENTATMPPDEALAAIEEQARALDELVTVAPDDISADLKTVVDVSQQINDVLIAAGGDESQIDNAAMEAIFTESFTEEFGGASQRVEDWADANCT